MYNVSSAEKIYAMLILTRTTNGATVVDSWADSWAREAPERLAGLAVLLLSTLR